VKSISFKNNLK